MTKKNKLPKPILQINRVEKIFQNGAVKFQALKNVDLTINAGEFLGIIGKSGAGKSTLLNMISGVSSVTSGEVVFNDPELPDAEHISVHSLTQDELARWRGQNIGIVYQSFELMPMLDLVNNVMLPQDFSGLYQPKISRAQAIELLEKVGLGEHVNKIPAHVSGGQKQRVAIARALANDPPILIADEPTGNLDSKTAVTIFKIFEQLIEQGKTIIMVTHDQNLAPRFDRCLTISDGELLPQLSPHLQIETAAPLQTNHHGGNGVVHTNGRSPLESETYAVQLNEVVKTYVGPAGSFSALKGIDLQLQYGDFISIVGKSGSGKSTLLNMLTGIDHPTSGEVIIGGRHIYNMSESQRALWRGQNLGIVFQFFQLLPTLTLLENVILPMDYCNAYAPKDRRQRGMALLEKVGLAEFARKLPASVSTGQQQSAAIARSLATDPDIIVADEPTGNLDTRSADKIVRLFSDLASQGKTILIVTHDPSITNKTNATITIADGLIVDNSLEAALSFQNRRMSLDGEPL